jgi:hypothetical protein
MSFGKRSSILVQKTRSGGTPQTVAATAVVSEAKGEREESSPLPANGKSNKRKASEISRDPVAEKKRQKPATFPTANAATKLLEKSKKKDERNKKQAELAKKRAKREAREEDRFGVTEHVRKTAKLTGYEKDLMSFCVEAYELCVDEEGDLEGVEDFFFEAKDEATATATEGGHVVRRGRSPYESHLMEALNHIREAYEWKGGERSGIAPTAILEREEVALPSKREGKKPPNSESSRDRANYLDRVYKRLNAHLSGIGAKCVAAGKLCKKTSSTLDEVRGFLEDWEAWKVHYVSEIRVQFDPVFCGGMTKPTMETLSAQSTASKERLKAARELATQKAALLRELEALESRNGGDDDGNERGEKSLRKARLDNALLENVGSSMALSRQRLEHDFLDVLDRATLDRGGADRRSGASGTLRRDGRDRSLTSAHLRLHHQNDAEKWATINGPSSGVNDDAAVATSSPPPSKKESRRSSVSTDTNMPDLSSFKFPTAVDRGESDRREKPPEAEESERTARSPRPEEVPLFGKNAHRLSGKETETSSSASSLSVPGKKNTATVTLGRAFASNPVSEVRVDWKANVYDVPLERANWASKTTVRTMHHGDKFR